jgi:hypothetical protein
VRAQGARPTATTYNVVLKALAQAAAAGAPSCFDKGVALLARMKRDDLKPVRPRARLDCLNRRALAAFRGRGGVVGARTHARACTGRGLTVSQAPHPTPQPQAPRPDAPRPSHQRTDTFNALLLVAARQRDRGKRRRRDSSAAIARGLDAIERMRAAKWCRPRPAPRPPRCPAAPAAPGQSWAVVIIRGEARPRPARARALPAPAPCPRVPLPSGGGGGG